MQLLWALLNIAVFVAFLGLCMEATKLLRRSIGTAAAVIFVLGLLSFIGGGGDRRSVDQDVTKLGMVSGDSLNPASVRYFHATLEENLISDIYLTIKYEQDEAEKLIPTDAFSTHTGFTGGFVWQPRVISVETSRDGLDFNYTVTGTLEWKLLGATVYTQSKTYSNLPSAEIRLNQRENH